MTGSDDAADDRLERAAHALYDLIQPEDALPWDGLTHGQQDRYRHLATMAARMTDVTALRAAFERGAAGIASHFGVSLRDCRGPSRRGFRFQAMDCIRAFEDSLMHGTAESDQRTLALQHEEQREKIEELHAQALAEDAQETAKRQARHDIGRYGRAIPINHEGAVTGDGRY